MATTKIILFTIICYFHLTYAKPQYEGFLDTFWTDAKSGELLRSLDALTSISHEFSQPQEEKEANVNQSLLPPQTKAHILLERIGEGSAESFEDTSPYDYNKAYEDFVKKYFKDSVTEALSASGSEENDDENEQEAYSSENLESSENEELISESSNKAAKTEKCRNVVRGKQNCLICKNSRNGETSESCSYNEQTKPQSYEFEQKNNYRKYRKTPRNNQEDDGSTEHIF